MATDWWQSLHYSSKVTTQRWTPLLSLYLRTFISLRCFEMLRNNISFVYLWPHQNKQWYIRRSSEPAEAGFSQRNVDAVMSWGRWSVQTNTWLSEPREGVGGSKVRRKYEGNLSFSFRWLDLLSVMNEREMRHLKVLPLILNGDVL